MHKQHAVDTSAQAMTEVALGLSMAFFALLIVALLSFQMPEQHSLASQTPVPDNTPQKNVQLQAQQSQPARASDTQFIFFYQGRFVDQQIKPVNINQLSDARPVVLAVEQSLSFAEVMSIRQQINHPNLSITLLSKQWQNVLEQH